MKRIMLGFLAVIGFVGVISMVYIGTKAVSREAANTAMLSDSHAVNQLVVWETASKEARAHYINGLLDIGGYGTACGRDVFGPPHWSYDSVKGAAVKGHKPCPDCIRALDVYSALDIWKQLAQSGKTTKKPVEPTPPSPH